MNKFSVVCLTVGVGIGSLGAGMALQAALFDVPDRGPSHVAPEIKREPANPRALPGVAAPTNRTNPEIEKVTVGACNELARNTMSAYRAYKSGQTRADRQKILFGAVDEVVTMPELNKSFKSVYSSLLDTMYGGKYVYTTEQLYNYAYQACDLALHNSYSDLGYDAPVN